MPLIEHALSNGQRIRLVTLTGTVVGTQQDSWTSVNQGAATVLSKDLVIPGQVYSTTHVKQEVWLRGADGKEQCVELAGFNIPAREGHVVSVLWGGPARRESGGCFGARNHTTGEVRCDVTVLGQSLKEWKLKVGAGSSLALWTLGAALILSLWAFSASRGGIDKKAAMALGAALVGGFVGLGAWVFVGSNLGPERRAVALTREINELGRNALQHEWASQVSSVTSTDPRPIAV
jgi:hypothetical protein